MNLPMIFALGLLFLAAASPLDASEQNQPAVANDRSNVDAGAELPTLGDTEFSIRRQSTMELWRDRDQYRDAVLRAVRSDDLETAERAKWVQRRWQQGILVDTPTEVAERLNSLEPGEAIELLLELSDFRSAAIALQESVGTIHFNGIATRIAMTLNQRFPIYASNAVERGTEADLLRFLDFATITKELAVCRRDWARSIGDDSSPSMDGDGWQWTSPDAWADDEMNYAKCLLFLLDGDAENALRVANQTDQQGLKEDERNRADSTVPMPLTRVVDMVLSRWQTIANDSAMKAAKLSASGEHRSSRPEEIRWWSDALIGASRAGDDDLAQKAIDGLKWRPGEEGAKSPDADLPAEVATLASRSLLIHGQIDAAIKWATISDPNDAAAIASAASRCDEAIQILGFAANDIDTQLDRWIDEAVAAQRKLFEGMNSDDPATLTASARQSPSGLATELDRMFSLMRLLLSVGRDDAAWRIADGLSLENLSCKRPGQSASFLVRDYVLLSLMLTTRSDWMFELAYRDWETQPTLISQSLLARVLTSDDYQVLVILSQMVQKQDSTITSRKAFRIACEIARADAEDRQKHGHWITLLSQGLRDGSLRRSFQTDPTLREETLLDEFFKTSDQVWIDLFTAYGRPDLAEPLLQKLATGGDLAASLKMAQDYRLANSIPDETLDQSYQSIWDAVAKPMTQPDSSLNQNVSIGIKAVAARARLSIDRGDSRTASRLIDELKAMACTPSTDTRQLIADAMADLGQWEHAESIYRSLLIMTAISSDETQSLLDIAKNFQSFVVRMTQIDIERTESAMQIEGASLASGAARELRQSAIDWLDLAFAGTLATLEYRAPIYLIYPRLIARERLQIEIAKYNAASPSDGATEPSNRQAIDQLLDDLKRLDRLDITTSESILPMLREAGLNEFADRFMRDLNAASADHLKLFPADAMIANNVAWAAAVNQYDLPVALELSRRAVRLEPQSAVYRDTLAEILARMDRVDQALAIEKGSVLDDPGQWHLHEQIERFDNLLKQR